MNYDTTFSPFFLSRRDQKLKDTIVRRLEDSEKTLQNEMKERQESERDMRSQIDSQKEILTTYMDEQADTIRKMIGVSWELIELVHF